MEVTGCTFAFNSDQVTGGASGIEAYYGEHFLLEDCWFEGNVSTGGGPVDILGVTTSEIRGCTFLNNYSYDLACAGAISFYDTDGILHQNTFWGNKMGWTHIATASVVCVSHDATVTMTNNIIGGSLNQTAVTGYRGEIISDCNVYFANEAGNSYAVDWGPGDIEIDPEFCDVSAFDFTLQGTSPCLPVNNGNCSERIGAYGPACGTIGLEPTTWSRLKASYR